VRGQQSQRVLDRTRPGEVNKTWEETISKEAMNQTLKVRGEIFQDKT
jgi:hypothetical protein